MAAVYVLFSPELNRYYIGSCNEMGVRLQQHLNDAMEGGFTSRASDWQIWFLAEGLEYGQARRIEKHIKKMKSRKYLEDLIRHKEIFAKLKDKYQ